MKKIHLTLLALTVCCVLVTTPTQSFAQEQGNSAMQSEDDDDDFDYGWIGLIGLAGLLGLRKKDRDDTDVKRRV